MTSDITVKGIVLACFPQGEYGKRIVILTDTLGKITVFASGAAKQNSRIIGAVRPMTAAEFTLGEGRGAKSIHGIRVIDSFDEISMDPDTVFYGMYVLELADYFGAEGMAEEDARRMLNLMFVTLSALRKKELPLPLLRRIFELRMLVQEGLYTESPAAGSDDVYRLWQRTIVSPLSGLYDFGGKEADRQEAVPEEISASFRENVEQLMKQQVPVRLKTAALL